MLRPPPCPHASPSLARQVHPVAFDGKVLCFGGQRPTIYAYAGEWRQARVCASPLWVMASHRPPLPPRYPGIESLEVKWEASASLLTLKFRTFFAGSGRPSYGMFDDDDY